VNTCARLEQIFRDTLQIDPPAPTADMIEAGILDSLALVTLLFEIEQRLGVRIPIEALDVEQIRTTARLAALVDRLVVDADDASASVDGLRQ
jgi:D-alanine--poly(phosphoribitol) ligase subunit 2